MRPALLALLALAGCRHIDPNELAPDTCVDLDDRTFGTVTLCESGEIPNVFRVAWESPSSGSPRVEYGLDDDDTLTDTVLTQATPTGAAGTTGDIAILGVKSLHTYAFRAVTTGANGVDVVGDIHAFDVPAPLQGMPRFTITDYDPATTQDGEGGLVLTSLIQGGASYAVVIDRDGEFVWYHAADGGFSIPSVHPSPNDNAIVYTQNDRNQTSPYGGIRKVAVDGSYKTLTYTVNGHHDAVEVPGEDTIAYISADIRDGFDIGGETMSIAGDDIQEQPLGAEDDTTVHTAFSLFDDYTYPPWRTCSHFDAAAYNTQAKDWSHSNSLMVGADGDYYLMSNRFDAVIRVDRATGAVVWQIGDSLSDTVLDGTHNGDFTFVNGDEDRWSHGHMSQIWGSGAEGGMTIFDNGYHRVDADGNPQARSRATEYAWDEDARTVRRVWAYDMPNDGFDPLLGDVRHLADGNRLVSFTSSGQLQEVTNDGTVVWTASGDVGNGTGRVTYLRDLYTLDEGYP